MSRIDQHRINFGSLHNNECSQCSVTFTSYQEHKIHVDELHEGRWKYRCEYCPETFPAPDLAKKHVYEAHTDKNWICDKCGKGYAEENALKAHVQKCNPGAEFSCDQCEFQTTSSGHLKTHVSLKHTFLPCSVCGKIVPERYMNRHILNQHTENDDKPYPCQYCPKRFPHKKNLEEHENVHTGRKPFACGMCEKSFASAGNMYMHRRMAHFGYKRTK